MGVPPWYLIVLLSIYYRDGFGYIFVCPARFWAGSFSCTFIPGLIAPQTILKNPVVQLY
jgi:hypothetical protein